MSERKARTALFALLIVGLAFAGLAMAPTASACNAVIGDHQTVGVFGNCLSPDVYVLGEQVYPP